MSAAKKTKNGPEDTTTPDTTPAPSDRLLWICHPRTLITHDHEDSSEMNHVFSPSEICKAAQDGSFFQRQMEAFAIGARPVSDGKLKGFYKS